MCKKSYWIWHYGEYEIYHSMKLNLRREERGMEYPPFWRLSAPEISVKFIKDFTCDTEDNYIIVHSFGKGYVDINAVKYPLGEKIRLTKDSYTITVNVFKSDGLPSIFVESNIIPSGDGWFTSFSKSGEKHPVGWKEYYDSPEKNPEFFPFEYRSINPISTKTIDGGILYDFGKETFGYLNLASADPNKKLCVCYGESLEEATDTAHSYIFEEISGSTEYKLKQRAFRYIYIKNGDKNLLATADYEYLPLKKRASFKCNNDLFNKIWETAAYTYHLCSREVLIDGIKRDRWVWSGDAYQCAKINNYLFFDADIIRRTAIGLIGKEPFYEHINTIVDYSLFWIIGLYEYYFTFGDSEFLKHLYGKAVKLMEFCESRLNCDGFIEGAHGDWIFIDWSDIDKTGAVAAEQMLLIAAYKALANISKTINKDFFCYDFKAKSLLKKVNEFYWDDEKGGFIDSYSSGKRSITRHANIFAIMYDIATLEQIKSIIKNVLKNDSVTKITTPYFKGYELDVMGKLGEYASIEKMLEEYWGGMIKLGATTFWEEYDPNKTGTIHYAMYGNKYEKSLCHAWSAGPIYLFGRYYLGVYPTSAGYETFNVEPNLGGIKKIEGTVPINSGEVRIYLDDSCLKVTATKSGGTLIFKGEKYSLPVNEEFVINKEKF